MTKNDVLILAKLAKFGYASAIEKALEEVNELKVELETLLRLWQQDGADVYPVVERTAKEYADVVIAVGDTFSLQWPYIFPQIVEAKRNEVYGRRLPDLLREGNETA